ncbi:aromatic ring-hydroxylating dioxygenase subunit alpha [Cupriavidus sp. 2SB]|uniref:aromatic ring-hydroxylating dioxygenase subunit alpha n=1 Tax=Cupriavidus sp. 2SB TaxID=2502199 RepID=UPI0010F73DFF|nr:aromatic ring-hydroxylating dioxygenase subunit alpha [Cupriavidus sp. 2SB]
MTYPRNCWYVAAMSHEIARALTARTLLNEPVLLFRREDGSVAAIEDRCSHRRVSLSLGTLIGDRVQCGYHGLQFDGNGSCVRIPGQDRIPPQACIRAYPVVEQDGFVWFWPGQRELADASTVPDFSDTCSSNRFVGRRANTLPVAAPCLFNIENVLDLSHVSYAHEKTVGTREVAETRPETEITDAYVEVRRTWDRAAAPPMYQRLFDWKEVKRTQAIRFWPGGNVRLQITVEPVGNTEPNQVRHLHVVGPCTPETDTTHFKFSAMYRDFALDDGSVTDTIAEQFHKTILEDKVLMEDQQRNWNRDGEGVTMIDLAVDRAPLAARRLLLRLAQSERQ